MRLHLKKLVHPGEVLKELYLDPLGMSAYSLARCLDVPRTRIERLVKCETSMTIDTAMRLSTYFGTSEELWLNMQQTWDIVHVGKKVDTSKIKPLKAA